MTACRGDYLHFRCDKHEVEGSIEKGTQLAYRCGSPGCKNAARPYWYRGEQFATLKTKG